MTPELILFQSFCFLFYLINTSSIFYHAYNSKIITMDYVNNIIWINYELIYIYSFAYIVLESSQYIYSLMFDAFNYSIYISNKYKFESQRFNFIKNKSYKKKNIIEDKFSN